MRSRRWSLLVSMLLIATGMPATAEQNAKQHRLVERSFHPLLDEGSNQGPPAVHVTDDGRLFAYVGTWGGIPCKGHTNPQSGVKVVDLTDPDEPRLTGVIPAPVGADVKAEGVVTVSIDGEPRDVLVVALQPCNGTVDLPAQAIGGPASPPAPWTGIEVHDVTDPEDPTKLGSWASGGWGIHNLSVFTRPDLDGRVFVAAAHMVAPDETALPSVLRRAFLSEADSSWVDGYLQVVEVTDPTDPTLVATWGLDDGNAVCLPQGPAWHACYVHDVQVSADGRTAYVAYWDAGVVVLDISDPAAPTLIGQWISADAQANAGEIEPDEGAVHTVVPLRVDGRDLVLVTEEQFRAGGASIDGSLRVVDVTDPDPARWEQVAIYDVPNADREGWFYAHIPVVGPTFPGGGEIYLSAWQDGMRVLALEDAGTSIREVAWFVSDAEDHPDDLDEDAGADHGIWGAVPLIHPVSGELLILASDVNRGLYVLEPSEPQGAASGSR